jgi:hypothetical protein
MLTVSVITSYDIESLDTRDRSAEAEKKPTDAHNKRSRYLRHHELALSDLQGQT